MIHIDVLLTAPLPIEIFDEYPYKLQR